MLSNGMGIPEMFLVEEKMANKAFVSFFILTYNQEKYVRDCLRSVFAQKYQPLEIIISDDCSADNTFDIISEEAGRYTGPHEVVLNKNPENVGLADNMNRAWSLSKGKYIIAGAGDDLFSPDRTDKLVKRLEDKDSPVDLVVSYFAEIDKNGKETGFIKKDVAFLPDESIDVLKWRSGATGACAAYNRKLYEKYGPLDPGVVAEDWVFSFRAWLEAGIAVLDEPLVFHRTHDQGLSVMHKNVKKDTDHRKRWLLRRKAAQNRYAIAKEWLKAFQISGRQHNNKMLSDLYRLVRVRQMQYRVFDAKKIEVLKIAKSIVKDIGMAETSKLLIRHFIGLN